MKAQTSKRFSPKVNIRKDDTIQVLSGDDKGKKGRVLDVDLVKSRVLVEGVTRVGRKTEKGKSVRISKKSGEVIK